MERPATSQTRSTQAPRGPLDAKALASVDAWLRAANYLAVGQIYLMDNPLLRGCRISTETLSGSRR